MDSFKVPMESLLCILSFASNLQNIGVLCSLSRVLRDRIRRRDFFEDLDLNISSCTQRLDMIKKKLPQVFAARLYYRWQCECWVLQSTYRNLRVYSSKMRVPGRVNFSTSSVPSTHYVLGITARDVQQLSWNSILLMRQFDQDSMVARWMYLEWKCGGFSTVHHCNNVEGLVNSQRFNTDDFPRSFGQWDVDWSEGEPRVRVGNVNVPTSMSETAYESSHFACAHFFLLIFVPDFYPDPGPLVLTETTSLRRSPAGGHWTA